MENNLAGRDIPGCNEEAATSGLVEDGVGEAGVQARPRVLHLALVRAVEQPAALPATHCGGTGGGADDTLLGGLGGRHAADGEGACRARDGQRRGGLACWRAARDSRAPEKVRLSFERRHRCSPLSQVTLTPRALTTNLAGEERGFSKRKEHTGRLRQRRKRRNEIY